MFGKSIERIAYEYLTGSVNQQEKLRSTLLRKDPADSAALLLVGGAFVLRQYGKANLDTPLRNAPADKHRSAMAYSQKIIDDIAGFAEIVGEEGVLEICHYLTSSEAETAILGCMVLLSKNGYSNRVLERIDHSLHNLNRSLSQRDMELIGSLIVLIQAEENYGQAYLVLQRESSRRGYDWRQVGQGFLTEAINRLIPYEIKTQRPQQPSTSNDDTANDNVAQWTHYWYNVDPDNAPWNH